MRQSSTAPELGERVLEAFRQRAPVKRRPNGKYRTKCLRPERHKHRDAHPSMDFDLEQGAICRVCGFKGDLVTLARLLGLEAHEGLRALRFKTADEAMRALMRDRKLRPETIAHFRIHADIKKQAWVYPLPSGHMRFKAFAGNAAPSKYWHERGTPNQLYGLDDIVQETEEAFIVNGEPAKWICYQAEVPAVCGCYGEGHLPEGILAALASKGVKRVKLVPDLDEPGRSAVLSSSRSLVEEIKRTDLSDQTEICVLALPEFLGEGADLGDLYVWCDGNDEVFRQGLDELPQVDISTLQGSDKACGDSAEDLMARLTLFHDQHAEPHVAFRHDGCQHILKVTSTAFRRWLSRQLYEIDGKAPSEDKLRSHLRVLEGQACFDGQCIPLHVRTAWHQEALYYDLGDWRAVRIASQGWEIVEEPPILFRHFPHQQPQVEPQRGGNLAQLDSFVNLLTSSQRLLFHVYLVVALVPDIARPVLAVHGDQGSGKSVLFRIVKKLLDPSTLETLSAPDTAREFVQLASHHFVVFLDNLSGLPGWLSDAFSRLSTGEGFSKRMLYTDDDDVVYALKGLGGINGINLVASRPDLLDRCIVLGLERISDKHRRPEREIWFDFEQARPRILGALFDALTGAMQELPNVNLTSLPRMADFAEWGGAVARALDYGETIFFHAYVGNLREQNDHALEVSPAAVAVRHFMRDRADWQGSPSQFLSLLRDVAEEAGVDTHDRMWPKDANWLGRRLREVRPNLAQAGIVIHFLKGTGGERRIVVERKADYDATLATAAANSETKPAGCAEGSSIDRGIVATERQIGEQFESGDRGGSGDSSVLPPDEDVLEI